ncbi:esterase-like activity of phytase family protein [Solitalea lacus]|uniref:esterase-like activity of phytase family protein n=1 Tax=Solitalea lacus TaxID=2911172 RepID=UPI001EDB5E55|nr:esterase-like activity of phytase family protein [Solitalea lacus]UKJ05885.1 esterase-like activity of phytase family protein [Solitalea lacus]
MKKNTGLILLTFIFISFIGLLASCKKNIYTGAMATSDSSFQNWRFIGEQILPTDFMFQSTPVGGLSGIDFNPLTNQYYVISDDRSELAPARFYTFKLHFTANSFDSVKINGVSYLRQPNGNLYPSKNQDKTNVPDPESIRYVNATNTLLWTSEGDRKIDEDDTLLINPWLRETKTDGNYLSDLPIPENYNMQKKELGMRQNGSVESLALTPDEQFIYIVNEEPLFQDGPPADFNETESYVRITKIKRTTKEILAQYAYKLDKVHAAPLNPNGFKINGVAELLAISENKLYVMERSFAIGATPSNSIRVFEVDLQNATNVINMPSLANAQFKPVAKQLVYNLSKLKSEVDNVEGICFGPNLPNGNKTILLVSDNNFSTIQKTQFLVFELIK